MTAIMPVWHFGNRLLDTKDLDPVYVGLVGARLESDQRARWLFAYWAFYHVGLASFLSELEGREYWRWLRVAAVNDGTHGLKLPTERWPRAAERRHFRGKRCVDAVDQLSRTRPEERVDSLRDCTTAEEVMDVVQGWPMFGPWIAFKAADMLERCDGVDLAFERDLGLVYQEPRSALDILSRYHTVRGERWEPMVWWNMLLERWQYTPAPPQGSRRCGPQEVETILCKWKSHQKGNYPVGKDIHEVREALPGWGPTADKILAAMPAEVPGEPT
jgi:hypothetical protein